MIWFTSDLHLGHRAAINMCGRPFENVEEMNKILIRNFNSCVKKYEATLFEGMYYSDFLGFLDKFNGCCICVWLNICPEFWTA